MKMQINIYAGIGEHADHSLIRTDERVTALETIRTYLSNTFGGYTETAASGGWVNANGELVTEPSVVFTMIADSSVASVAIGASKCVIHEAAHMIAEALQQETVLVTVTYLEHMAFIGQE